MTIEAQARSNRLPILATSINDHLGAAEAATRRGLEHAIAAGALLLEAKELVAHGGWLPWLQENCHINERSAQVYMRLARNRHKLDALKNESTADLTIAAAEALVGRPKPERPHGLPGQLDMLGAEEVVARPPALRGRTLFDLIVDLEQALAIIEAWDKDRRAWSPALRRQSEQRRRNGLPVIASIISATIEHLEAQRRRQQRTHR